MTLRCCWRYCSSDIQRRSFSRAHATRTPTRSVVPTRRAPLLNPPIIRQHWLWTLLLDANSSYIARYLYTSFIPPFNRFSLPVPAPAPSPRYTHTHTAHTTQVTAEARHQTQHTRGHAPPTANMLGAAAATYGASVSAVARHAPATTSELPAAPGPSPGLAARPSAHERVPPQAAAVWRLSWACAALTWRIVSSRSWW